jgi:glycerophosphoryl diester phosphodiesterase
MKPEAFMIAVCAGFWLAACSATGAGAADPSATGNAWAGLPEPLVPAVAPEGQVIPDVLRCLRDQDAAFVSAHRGGVEPGYPENAIETFANTLAQGPMILEVDIQRTADGIIIALHDDTLERTTTGEGQVDAMAFADLVEVRLVDEAGQVTDFAIPTLADVLDWARGRAFVQLDVKTGLPVEEVVAGIVEANAISYAAVVVYTAEEAIRVARADPRVAISVEIQDQERLDALLDAGIAPERLMAWTGVHAAPVPDTWDMLHGVDIPAAFGALWYIDNEVRESGDASIYRDIADGGVVVIATDIHWTAYDALAERQDTLGAFRRCTGE